MERQGEQGEEERMGEKRLKLKSLTERSLSEAMPDKAIAPRAIHLKSSGGEECRDAIFCGLGRGLFCRVRGGVIGRCRLWIGFGSWVGGIVRGSFRRLSLGLFRGLRSFWGRDIGGSGGDRGV